MSKSSVPVHVLFYWLLIMYYKYRYISQYWEYTHWYLSVLYYNCYHHGTLISSSNLFYNGFFLYYSTGFWYLVANATTPFWNWQVLCPNFSFYHLQSHDKKKHVFWYIRDHNFSWTLDLANTSEFGDTRFIVFEYAYINVKKTWRPWCLKKKVYYILWTFIAVINTHCTAYMHWSREHFWYS